MTPKAVHVGTFNFKNGGRLPGGGFDFSGLGRAFDSDCAPLDLLVVCEANRWADDGQVGLLGAAAELSARFGEPYVGMLAETFDRGPFPPAIFYNPGRLRLEYWGSNHPSVADGEHNLARFMLPNGRRLELMPEHWDYRSGAVRLETQAKRLGHYGTRKHTTPMLIAGDLNGTASGPHLPTCDWHAEPEISKRHHKGMQLADGSWVADTRAVDFLVGPWNPRTARREQGAGFTMIAEMEWQQSQKTIEPTVNPRVDRGGGLLIDLLLANAPLAECYVLGSYHVHIPETPQSVPSDHRAVTAVFAI